MNTDKINGNSFRIEDYFDLSKITKEDIDSVDVDYAEIIKQKKMNKEKQKQFDEKYLRIAKIWSENSYAERLQVGCIIVKDNMIISDGFNGTPCGFENVCEDENNKTKPYVLHAEANAITKLAKSHNSSVGATLYVTHSPCIECAKLIIQSGIARVVYIEQYRSDEGIKLLQRANIKVEQLNPCHICIKEDIEQYSKANSVTAEAVDLGLPSGIKWANKNLCAKYPWEYGAYFQFGSVTGYDKEEGLEHSYWKTSPCNGGKETFDKDEIQKWNKDNTTNGVLKSDVDAATVHLGKGWRMPTEAEFQELINNTKHEWTTMNNVNGYKFINKSDSSKYIFIPASGGLWQGSSGGVGEYGRYWSSSLIEVDCFRAWHLGFGSGGVHTNGYYYRSGGLPVRGVFVQ